MRGMRGVGLVLVNKGCCGVFILRHAIGVQRHGCAGQRHEVRAVICGADQSVSTKSIIVEPDSKRSWRRSDDGCKCARRIK